MVGLKNPCKKCIVQASCSQTCDEYRSYNKKFGALFSSESLSAFLSILTYCILIICPFLGMTTKTFFIILGIQIVFGVILGVTSFFVSIERQEDHLFDFFKYLTIVIVGLPSLIGIIIATYLEKFSECSAYKK